MDVVANGIGVKVVVAVGVAAGIDGVMVAVEGAMVAVAMIVGSCVTCLVIVAGVAWLRGAIPQACKRKTRMLITVNNFRTPGVYHKKTYRYED